MAKPQPTLTKVQLGWLMLNGYTIEDKNNKDLKRGRWKAHIKKGPGDNEWIGIAQCGGMTLDSVLIPATQQITCINCIKWVQKRVSG